MFGTDFALALTALGALAAIVIPFGIWYFTREARYQIDILVEKEVFLVNQVARDLNNIRILIDGNPASEQVVWITGWIINSGKLDVSDRSIEKPLRLILPEGMSWLRATIDHSSPDVHCNLAIVDENQIVFSWTLLRSGEYIHYDCLIQCPNENDAGAWDRESLEGVIRPYSRIENTRTDTIVPISPLLGKDNKPLLRRRVIRKVIMTSMLATLYAVMWMMTFFPHDFDSFFDDGYLRANPSVVKSIEGETHELSMSIDRFNNVKLELDEPPVELFYSEDQHSRIFDSKDLTIGKISSRDLSKESGFIALISCVTFIVIIASIMMWLPTKYLMGSRMRRAAAALHVLRKGR